MFEGRELVLGGSEVFLRALWEMLVVSGHDVSVLIEGESGTGKELFGRAIHELSPRRNRAFIPVNCAALPRELAESEFFGHVQGAFTGAARNQAGLVGQAKGGTLFLDEISSLDLRLQAKLLRFLDSGEFRPVGSSSSCVSNVRVIAAANTDLRAESNEGRFRSDLFHRLSTCPIRLPALRQRPRDIKALAEHFAVEAARRLNRPPAKLSSEALAALCRYHWPGNVRELNNVVTQITLRGAGRDIDPEDLPLFLRGEGACDGQISEEPQEEVSERLPAERRTFQEEKARVVAQFERRYLEDLMRSHRGNVTQAARSAGKHRRALSELLKKYSLSPDVYRRR